MHEASARKGSSLTTDNKSNENDRKKHLEILDKETLIQVLEQLPMGVYIADHTGTIIYGNPAGEQIWNGLRYVPPDKYSEYNAWWTETGECITGEAWALHRAVTKGETSTNEEIEIECFDGSHKILLNSAWPLFDENQNNIGGFATNQDITTEKSLASERNQLSEYPIRNPNPVLQLNHEGFIQYANPASEPILAALNHTNGTPLHPAWMDLIKRCLKTAAPLKYEMHIGNEYFSFSFAPVAPGLVNVYALDITDRKHAEDALSAERDILQAVMDGARNSHLVYLDRDFNFVKVNEVYAATCGYTAAEMVGKNHFTLYPNEENLALFERVRDTGEPIEIHDKPFTFPDQPERGTTYWDWSLTPVKDSRGFVHGLIFSLFDTTQRKRYENILVRSQKLESLGHLAAGIAHDFNNLLGGIFGYIDLSLLEAVSPEVKRNLSNAASAIDRARKITQQLITFSVGGKPQLKQDDIAPAIVDAVTLALSGSSHTAEFTIAPDLRQCRFDLTQISQVIHNLTLNAQQAMPGGGVVTVTVANCNVEATIPELTEGEYIKISVHDSGCGIAKDIQHKIFDPFFTTKELGKGLGLSTSISIVSKHGGAIDMESTPNAGNTFPCYLPAVTTEKETSDNQGTASITVHPKLLLMEDDESILKTTAGILRKLGFHVVMATNGMEAFEKFSAAQTSGAGFNCIILDLTIRSGWGGIQTANEIRKLDGTVPVIVISGYANDPAIAEPEKYGFTDSLRKPFTMLELTDVLSKNIGHHKT